MAGETPWVGDVEHTDYEEYDGTVFSARQLISDDVSIDQDAHKAARFSQAEMQYPRKPRPTAGEKLNATMRQFNPTLNNMDANKLEKARQIDSPMEIPNSVLQDRIPSEMQLLVLQEKQKYGSQAASVMADQIREDIANNSIFDNLEWYEQLGYSVPAALADPLTIAAPVAAAKVSATLIKGAAKTAVYSGKVAPKATKVFQGAVGSKMSQYAAAGVMEAVAFNAPRLAGDHTYTPQDFENDVIIDSVLGAGLTKMLDFTARGISKQKQAMAANKRSLEDQMVNYDNMLKADKADAADFKPDFDPTVPPRGSSQKPEGKPASTFGAIDPEVPPLGGAQNFDASVPPRGTSANAAESILERPVASATNAGSWMSHATVSAMGRLKSMFNDLPVETQSAVSKLEFEAGKAQTLDEVVTLTRAVQELEKQTTYYHGTMSDFKDYQPAEQAGGLIFFTPDPKIANKYASLDSAGYTGSGAAEEVAETFKRVREELHPDAFEGYRLKEDVTYDKLVDVLHDSDAHVTDILLDDLEAGTITSAEATSRYNDVLPEFAEGGNVRMAHLDVKNPAGSPDNPVPWENAEKVGASGYKAQGFDGVYVQEQGGWALAVFDNAQIKNPLEIPVEVKAALDLHTASRAAADIEVRSTMRTANGSKVKSSVDVAPVESVQAVELDDLPVKTKEAKAVVENQSKIAASVKEHASPLKVTRDEVSTQELTEAIDDIKKGQEEAKAANPEFEGLDVSTGKLQDAGDEAAELATKPDVAEAASKVMLRKSFNKTSAMVAKYHGSGEHNVYRRLLTPKNIRQMAARTISQFGGVTRDIATKFIESKSPTLNWMGTHFTEMGRGYGGDVMRKATAGVIRDAEYMRSASMVLPAYEKAVKAYATRQGGGALDKLLSGIESGQSNKIVRQFNRDFMVAQNNARLGRPTDPAMKEFMDTWNKYMDHNYESLEMAGIKGFTGKNKRNNYVPQVWKMEHAQRLLKEDPNKVYRVIKAALVKEHPTEDSAMNLVNWLKTGDAADYDGFVPGQDARSHARMELDWDTEVDGLHILDLLETDTAKLATSYSNRTAGWVAVSKASDGNITSYTDLETLKYQVYQETGDVKDVQTVEDVTNMLFGRAVQGGLPDWARSVKDATTLSKMGGLGAAQAIESGNLAARAMIEAAGDPKFLNYILKGDKDAANELINIVGNHHEYHTINRAAEYYTGQQHGNSAEVGEGINRAVDLATGGRAKAMFGRGLGHVTGYNKVLETQRTVFQRSFTASVTRHFMFGQGKMSPKRMADLGLTDSLGKNSSLQQTIRKHVEFNADGYPTKFDFDNWPAADRDTFLYAMTRAEAQDILRPLVGEMPSYFNKPLMNMLMQFRTMPVLAQNKSLGRSLAFADKEAAMQLAFNTMTAGVVRGAKVLAGAGAYAAVTGEDFDAAFDKELGAISHYGDAPLSVDRYITQFGLLADVYPSAMITGQVSTPEDFLKKASGEVPAMQYVYDYVNTAYQASQGEGDKAWKSAQRVMFLGNSLAGETALAAAEDQVRGTN
ncbi:hypothetical protein VPHK436_0051 [Vibrio phage K436]